MHLKDMRSITSAGRSAGFVAAWLATMLPSSLIAIARAAKTGIDTDTCTPKYVTGIAGAETVDTAAECAKVTPLEHQDREADRRALRHRARASGYAASLTH